MAVTKIDDYEFRQFFESNTTMFVHFSATWCSPCKKVRPEFELLSNDYNGRVNFYEMDVDNCQETAEQFGIRLMPTLMFFKAGNMTAKIAGSIRGADMKSLIDKYL